MADGEKVLASIPSDWKGFLRVDGNKDELFKLLINTSFAVHYQKIYFHLYQKLYQ